MGSLGGSGSEMGWAGSGSVAGFLLGLWRLGNGFAEPGRIERAPWRAMGVVGEGTLAAGAGLDDVATGTELDVKGVKGAVDDGVGRSDAWGSRVSATTSASAAPTSVQVGARTERTLLEPSGCRTVRVPDAVSPSARSCASNRGTPEVVGILTAHAVRAAISARKADSSGHPGCVAKCRL